MNGHDGAPIKLHLQKQRANILCSWNERRNIAKISILPKLIHI